MDVKSNIVSISETDSDFDTNNKEYIKIRVSSSQNPKSGLNIKKFNMNLFCDNPAISIIGKRGSGKTTLIKNIMQHLYNNKQVDEFIVISPLDNLRKSYEDFVNKVYGYDNELIEQILHTQDENITNAMRTNTPAKKIMVILDDCLVSKGLWMNDHALMELLFNGRHYNISYIFTMKFPLGITPELRCNFDYIFLFNEDNYNNLKRLYDHYAGFFPTFASFKVVLNRLSQNYGTMTIINRGVYESFLDKIYFYKATILKNKLYFPNVSLCEIKKNHLNNAVSDTIDIDTDNDNDDANDNNSFSSVDTKTNEKYLQIFPFSSLDTKSNEKSVNIFPYDNANDNNSFSSVDTKTNEKSVNIFLNDNDNVFEIANDNNSVSSLDTKTNEKSVNIFSKNLSNDKFTMLKMITEQNYKITTTLVDNKNIDYDMLYNIIKSNGYIFDLLTK
jgi:tRNA A37 threonylcarbamoyladenosine biosynthesis protein TsaE